MRSARQGDAGQGGVPGASAVVAGGSAREACETPQGAWYTLVRATDQAAGGGHRPDDGEITRHNLHSM